MKNKEEKQHAAHEHGGKETHKEHQDIPEDSDDKKIKELQNTIQTLQKQKDETFAQLQRVSADYINYQKRVPKQISDTLHYEKERIIKSLLIVLDNFERTIQNADKSENIDALITGIRIIYNQMIEILKSHGVEQMETLGKTFDPSMHEAILRKTDSDKDDNIVLEEFQKGYILNGKVIRPGKVAVNKLPEVNVQSSDSDIQSTGSEESGEQDTELNEEPETTDTEQS